MDTMKLRESIAGLDILKKDAQINQRKGLPFMMASVVIWSLILIIRLTSLPVIKMNLYTFICSALLMPLAYIVSKMLKADVFKKTENPINKLGFLCTLNQMLYLIIVMWAFSKSPEAMVMLYAIVFGAHLLPYGWVYDSRTYTIAAIIETIGSLILFQLFGGIITVGFIIAAQIVVSVSLAIENRKAM